MANVDAWAFVRCCCWRRFAYVNASSLEDNSEIPATLDGSKGQTYTDKHTSKNIIIVIITDILKPFTFCKTYVTMPCYQQTQEVQ